MSTPDHKLDDAQGFVAMALFNLKQARCAHPDQREHLITAAQDAINRAKAILGVFTGE